jgi:hypothetical protein
MLDDSASNYPSSIIQLSKIAETRSANRAAERGKRTIYDSEVWPPIRRITQSRLVEIAGIEPATSGLQSRRSPN